MEKRLKERLIEAARFAEASKGFRLTLTSLGIFVQYVWEKKVGQFTSVDHFETWEVIESADVNILVLAMNSLTKRAAAKQ